MFIFKNLYNLLEAITDYALKELYDEQELKRKLMELAVFYEMGEISDKEFNEMEQKLLNQLREAREYNSTHKEIEGNESDEEDEEVR